MGEIALYCPLCGNNPTAPRIWCAVIEQPICSSCSDVLKNEFSQPIDLKPDTELGYVLSRLIDVAELPIAECAAIWLLKEIEGLTEEFRFCYDVHDYATGSWSRPMIGELLWHLNEIDALSGLLCHPGINETPQAKYHRK